MSDVVSKLTVLFSDPFWIGIYERTSENRYEVSKIVFGAEPKDYEVYEFMLKNWAKLRFSPSFSAEIRDEKYVNPKRMQRAVHRQVEKSAYIGTKAQQALKLQQEQSKLEHKEKSKEERDAEAERKFRLKQEKRLEKHKGH